MMEEEAVNSDASTHYEAEVKCNNCGILKKYNIPKGETVKDFSYQIKCPNCGCYMGEKTFKW